MTGEMNEVFVWVVDDDTDGKEGTIMAFIPAIGAPGTLMSRQRKIAEALRPFAEAHGQAVNRPVRLLRFSGREVVIEAKEKTH